MRCTHVLRTVRAEARLSLRALAEAAGVATSTVHRIEQGTLHPTVHTLERITEAAGMRLTLDVRLDYAASVSGLARSIAHDVADGDTTRPVRMASELVRRFRAADADARRRMIGAEPPPTGDARWDAFVAALAEWLAVTSGGRAPGWTARPERFLRRGWWVTPMTAMHPWEYAGSPVSFQSRGVYLHRQSLVGA